MFIKTVYGVIQREVTPWVNHNHWAARTFDVSGIQHVLTSEVGDILLTQDRLDATTRSLPDPSIREDEVPWIGTPIQAGDIIASTSLLAPWRWVQGKPKPNTHITSHGGQFLLRRRPGVVNADHVTPGVILALRELHGRYWKSPIHSSLSIKEILAQRIPDHIDAAWLDKYLKTIPYIQNLEEMQRQADRLFKEIKASIAHKIFQSA